MNEATPALLSIPLSSQLSGYQVVGALRQPESG